MLQWRSCKYYIFWVCVCILALVILQAICIFFGAILYCHHCHIFSCYLICGKTAGKKLLYTKCVFWFSLQILPETFVILRRIQLDIIINVHISVFMWSTRYSCQILIKLQFSWQTLKKKKYNKYKISRKSIKWELSCSMQMDRQTDMM